MCAIMGRPNYSTPISECFLWDRLRRDIVTAANASFSHLSTRSHLSGTSAPPPARRHQRPPGPPPVIARSYMLCSMPLNRSTALSSPSRGQQGDRHPPDPPGPMSSCPSATSSQLCMKAPRHNPSMVRHNPGAVPPDACPTALLLLLPPSGNLLISMYQKQPASNCSRSTTLNPNVRAPKQPPMNSQLS